MRSILVAGGAGFLGSHLVRHLLQRHAECRVVALDKRAAGGSLENLEPFRGDPRLCFVQGDICDPVVVRDAMAGCEAVVNLAAEAPMDRSLLDSGSFVRTDVSGTYVLLEAAVQIGVARLLSVSTTEVYGPCAAGAFRETAAPRPCALHAASRVGAEMLTRAYHLTCGLAGLVTRGCRTMGPFDDPQRPLPSLIIRALQDRPFSLPSDGECAWDWISVEDHCAAIDLVLRRGLPGEVYNVSSGQIVSDQELARTVLELLGKPDELLRTEPSAEPGPVSRYAADSSKLRALGWAPRDDVAKTLRETVRWYEWNRPWWEKRTGAEMVSPEPARKMDQTICVV